MGTSLSEFTLFAEMGQELQDMVWNEALSEDARRVVLIEGFNAAHVGFNAGHDTGCRRGALKYTWECRNREWQPAHVLFRTCHAARDVVRKRRSASAVPGQSNLDPYSHPSGLYGSSFKYLGLNLRSNIFFIASPWKPYDRILHHMHSWPLGRDPREIHHCWTHAANSRPSNIMVSFRDMHRIMEKNIKKTESVYDDSPSLLLHVLETFSIASPPNTVNPFRTLTLLIIRTADEFAGKFWMEDLQEEPHTIHGGSGHSSNPAVLELARSPDQKSILTKIMVRWSSIMRLAEERNLQLPVLIFAARPLQSGQKKP